MENEERTLRKIYSEILSGFSISRYKGKNIYIKHFNSLDNLEADYLYLENLELAKKKGLLTESEKLEIIKKDNLWTDENESEISRLKEELSVLVSNKRKAFLKRNIDEINAQIKEKENLLLENIQKRENLIGDTAEKFAKRRADIYFVERGFFRDNELNEPLFTAEEFNDLDKFEMDELFSIQYEVFKSLSESVIKKITLQNFFKNAFYLTENIYYFFGKPISQLTFPQTQLCAYGSYYKNILSSENRPPENIANDPQKLEDWFNGITNMNEALSKIKDGDENSLVGLTNEDREYLGLEKVKSNNIHQKIKDNGGEISLQEIMKMEGVI